MRTILLRRCFLDNVDMTRLFLIDDQQLVLDVLATSLGSAGTIDVTGRLPTATGLVPALQQWRPDVVAVEVEDIAGQLEERIRSWRGAVPGARFAALTGSRDRALAVRAALAGIDVWIPKQSATETVIELLRTAKSGHAWYPPEYLPAILRRLRQPGNGPPRPNLRPFDVLSERELEVLGAIVDGARVPEIADRMRVSPHTVRTHTRNIFKKLQVHSGLQLVKIARAAGIGAPQPDQHVIAIDRAIHHDQRKGDRS